MQKCKKLPIGNSSFEIIQQDKQLYVDKTKYIFKMVDEGMYYFMSRPRRFGKSLTISTLRCLFQGKKELFDNLWIAKNTQWEWKKHPVILIDFNQISHDTPESLKAGLESSLRGIGQLNQIQLNESLLKEQFKELILALYQKTKMPVVILIDEYDKPLIDHLGKGADALEIAKTNRDILKYFFGVLKGGDVSAVLRFVFITGVSKFSRVSIFSELNNLKDLTMNRHYAEMAGYTQEELEICFDEHVRRFAKEIEQTPAQILNTLKIYYNGYRFSERNVRVYNPFSVLKALDEMAFKNYWFETGTPTFLVNLLKENNYPLVKIENLELDEQLFSVYDLDNLKPEALLFQTGYITITDVQDLSYIYTFNYPNQEVKISFLKNLLYAMHPVNGSDQSLFLKLYVYLLQEKLDDFFETVSAIFASIPYVLETKRDEAYFHTIFYLMVCASGANALSEVLNCKGRIDLLITFPDKIYIIEFKCNQSAQTGIQQIIDNGYADSYQQTDKKIILMGINFDSQKHNIAEWKIV